MHVSGMLFSVNYLLIILTLSEAMYHRVTFYYSNDNTDSSLMEKQTNKFTAKFVDIPITLKSLIFFHSNSFYSNFHTE